MDVKEAVREAKKYVFELFLDEEIMDLGLEEVKFDHCSNVWNVTVGFSRPWDRRFAPPANLREYVQRRSYKVLRINDENGRVESLEDRVLVDPLLQ